jgi:hypothetical protein
MYKVVASTGRKETVWQPYASREEAEAKLVALGAEQILGIGPRVHAEAQRPMSSRIRRNMLAESAARSR